MSGGGDTPKPGFDNSKTSGTVGTTGNNATTSSTSNTLTGGGTSLSTTTPDIPSWAYPLMQTVTGQYANALGNVNPADLNLSSVPMQQLLMTAQGGYLNGDQQQQQLDAISRSVLPKVTSAFGGAGRGNNFLGADTAARDISDSYLMNVFNPERERMMSATSQITPLEMSQYFGPTAQFGQLAQGLNPLFAPAIGSTTQGATTTNQISTGNSYVDELINGMVNSNSQTKGTNAPAYFPKNTGAGIAGGALSGAGTGAMIGSVVPGIGTAAGAGIGGLLGAFGGSF